MGHQVEYVIDLPPKCARDWLSSLPGWWAEPGRPSGAAASMCCGRIGG
jgi:hypothetical protein